MADDLQSYLAGLSKAMRVQLASVIEDEANGLADAIRAAAPRGETGALQASVRVEPGRHELEQIVMAGGDDTTGRYYDYAMAVEFGTQHRPATPFFWPTYRARRQKIRAAINAAIQEAMEG